MLKNALWIVAACVAGLLGSAYLLPHQVHIERAIVVQRAPDQVYPWVNSLRRFNQWSPWSGLDPMMKVTYTGPESGVGARMHWVGNSKVGVGTQRIVAATPPTSVDFALDFGEEGPSDATIRLSPAGAYTRVLWTLDLDVGNNPIGRYAGLFMERMIGPDYERGLANLKALVERQPASDATTSANAPTS